MSCCFSRSRYWDLIIEARWPKVKISTIDWDTWNKEYNVQLFRVKNVTALEIQEATSFAKEIVLVSGMIYLLFCLDGYNLNIPKFVVL